MNADKNNHKAVILKPAKVHNLGARTAGGPRPSWYAERPTYQACKDLAAFFEFFAPQPNRHRNPGRHRIGGMDAPFASGPVELFERLDNETVASAGAAASEGLVLTTLDKAVNWARKNSIWPMSFGLACCAIEMMSMSASRFDIARFGAEVFRGSPRQSDLIIIAGRVSNKMAPVIRHLYQQMPEPKWAISMGACATSTGVFNNYALIPVNQVIPIDVYVPGCPPRPEQLIQALMMLQGKIQNESGTVRQILNLA